MKQEDGVSQRGTWEQRSWSDPDWSWSWKAGGMKDVK